MVVVVMRVVEVVRRLCLEGTPAEGRETVRSHSTVVAALRKLGSPPSLPHSQSSSLPLSHFLIRLSLPPSVCPVFHPYSLLIYPSLPYSPHPFFFLSFILVLQHTLLPLPLLSPSLTLLLHPIFPLIRPSLPPSFCTLLSLLSSLYHFIPPSFSHPFFILLSLCAPFSFSSILSLFVPHFLCPSLPYVPSFILHFRHSSLPSSLSPILSSISFPSSSPPSLSLISLGSLHVYLLPSLLPSLPLFTSFLPLSSPSILPSFYPLLPYSASFLPFSLPSPSFLPSCLPEPRVAPCFVLALEEEEEEEVR
ncbi:uncharacterized protein LOC127001661 isoform X1 [Eriocheir sinensis]|uniref:uncharacterized protein LOC127001661 isoform X1 n=1 Tax=Eriocheir sinensis TaxID=95602 RepID=UPI0021C7A95B|nr:uncharacterized protein LOC127001661 isoform X1 [Eriocheir sinensis]XP_050722592.1 uncharacterized protein LOC127001661 isoform X1 [Eriocheir sinensis]